MKILCVDFDGVIHSYKSGWQGQTNIPDPPVPGAMQFLVDASKEFRVAVYSSRSTNQKGVDTMARWIAHYLQIDLGMSINDANEFAHSTLEWPTEKPAAFVTLDDRAICFTGTFPAVDELLNFKTWMQHGKREENRENLDIAQPKSATGIAGSGTGLDR